MPPPYIASCHIELGVNLEVSGHTQWNFFIKLLHNATIPAVDFLPPGFVCLFVLSFFYVKEETFVLLKHSSQIFGFFFFKHSIVLTESLTQAVIKALSSPNMLHWRVIDHKFSIFLNPLGFDIWGNLNNPKKKSCWALLPLTII